MADIQKTRKQILRWEGGYSNHPNDTGGCTMKGVTIGVYRKYYGKTKTCSDLRNITDDQWLHIFRAGYWDKVQGDMIENQSIANLVADMAWGSGTVTAIKKIQRCLGINPDGIVGPKTLALLNGPDKKAIHAKLWNMRKAWFEAIIKATPSKKCFLKGWLNRLATLNYEP